MAESVRNPHNGKTREAEATRKPSEVAPQTSMLANQPHKINHVPSMLSSEDINGRGGSGFLPRISMQQQQVVEGPAFDGHWIQLVLEQVQYSCRVPH